MFEEYGHAQTMSMDYGRFLPINGIKPRTLRTVSKERNPLRVGPGSFQFRLSFGAGCFGLGRWVVSA